MPAGLFEPIHLADLTLANRIVMAPLTRNRADRNGCPTPMMTTYYQQRASAGLIIAEAAPVSPQGVGAFFTPGIYSEEQAAGWRNITKAIHATGGHIFLQLQHCGRISHPSLLPDNTLPVAPSALRPEGQALTYTGSQDFVTPRALETGEIADVVAQFQHGAKMARQAGFDGVEILAANGFLIDQFLRDSSNQRTDAYGGGAQQRMRLLNEILDAVIDLWPANRVGVRLSPENRFNSILDSNPQEHFDYFIGQLDTRQLAYLHVLEGDMGTQSRTLDYAAFRNSYTGPYMVNNAYNLECAQAAVTGNAADLVAFGVPFVANPDLVYRFEKNLPLNEADAATLFGGGEAGYIDYPCFSDEYDQLN
ncbi:alkene reductase [Thiolapillus sp.]